MSTHHSSRSNGVKPDHHHGHHHFCGTTTLGEKGQIVVPAEVRKSMGLNSGDKLLVFCMGKNMVAFAKAAQLEKMAAHLSAKLEGLRAMMKEVR